MTSPTSIPKHPKRTRKANGRSLFWVTPTLKLLKKLGYLGKTAHGRDTEYKLIIFVVIIFGIGIITGSAPYYILNTINLTSSVFDIILGIILMIVGAIVSFGLIKEVISAEISALKEVELEERGIALKRKYEAQKKALIKAYRSKEKKLEAEYNAKLDKTSEHQYYLSRVMQKPDGLSIDDINLDALGPSMVKSGYQVLKDLDNRKKEIEKKQKIRHEMRAVEDLDWQAFSVRAIMILFEINHEAKVYKQPYWNLFQDVHAYLRAWLVCSIDNDRGEIMPVKVIGLHYHLNSRKEVNINTYIRIFSFIRDSLLTRYQTQKSDTFSLDTLASAQNYLDKLQSEIMRQYSK